MTGRARLGLGVQFVSGAVLVVVTAAGLFLGVPRGPAGIAGYALGLLASLVAVASVRGPDSPDSDARVVRSTGRTALCAAAVIGTVFGTARWPFPALGFAVGGLALLAGGVLLVAGRHRSTVRGR